MRSQTGIMRLFKPDSQMHIICFMVLRDLNNQTGQKKSVPASSVFGSLAESAILSVWMGVEK